MNNNEYKTISDFPKHIFWNYKSDAELDKYIVIVHVILYGELNDYRKLMSIVSKDNLRKMVEELEKSGRYKEKLISLKEFFYLKFY